MGEGGYRCPTHLGNVIVLELSKGLRDIVVKKKFKSQRIYFLVETKCARYVLFCLLVLFVCYGFMPLFLLFL